MTYKWVGAILVIAGCGGGGFSIASSYKREEKYLKQMVSVLQYMESELQYRLTPLPELCRRAGEEAGGILREILFALAKELGLQVSPDAYSCMMAAMRKSRDIPKSLRRVLLQLGHTLGRFDLNGQLCGLQAVRTQCEIELKKYEKDRDIRLRSYQTLGICAGVALAILFA